MKKSLALVLALVMMLSVFTMGFTVSAANTTKPQDAPADAIAINSVAGLSSMQAGKYYYLTADITIGSPQTMATQAEVGTQAAVQTPGSEAALITIPAGATLDGNGNTIYMGYYVTNPGWYATSNPFVHSLAWSHEMFALAGGNITIKNLNLGSKELPVYLSKSAATAGGDYTAYDGYGIFCDVAESNVTWNKVNFYVERYGRGLSGTNQGPIMFTVDGIHNFTDCSVNTPMVSAGSQYGGWFYQTKKTSSLTMTDCSTNGYVIETGYHEIKDEQGNVIGTEVAYLQPELVGSAGAAFVRNAAGSISMTNCTNNINISVTLASKDYSQYPSGGLVAQVSNNIYMNGCVNNGDITTGYSITIMGGIVGRNGTNARFQLINCVNNGNITRNGVTHNKDTNAEEAFTKNNGYGGITGHTGATELYEVIGCINNGDMINPAGNVGGVVGFAEGAATKTITNCENYGDITSTKSLQQQVEAAGIAGQVRGVVNVTNCSNFGNINALMLNGGIIGDACNDGTILTIKGCENHGTIGATNRTHAGGIMGQSSRSNNFTIVIEDCKNYGKVISKQYSAGFIAEAASKPGTIEINESFNFGEIAGVHAVAGFIGQTANNANLSIYINYSVNAGYVHQGPAAGEGIGGFFGRIAGSSTEIALTECANIGTIVGSTKNTAMYGAFGDTFGQFIGTYTVNLGNHYYAGNELAGGFVDWEADTAVLPYLDGCYAYGTAVPAEGAMSLTGWITAYYDGAGKKVDYAQADIPAASAVPVTEAPNNGLYGVNVAIDNSSYIYYLEDTTLEDAIEELSDLFYIDFTAGNVEAGEDIIVLATPELRGYQQSLDGGSIRFVASVNTSTYENLGFKYTVKLGNEVLAENVTVAAGAVWTALNAMGEDGTIDEVAAADLGAKYLTAITFNNIPELGKLTLEVTPIADDFVGTTYVVTITHGNITSVVAK